MTNVLLLEDHYAFTGDDTVIRCSYERIKDLLESASDLVGRSSGSQEASRFGFLYYAALRAAGRMALHKGSKADSNHFFLGAMDAKKMLTADGIPNDYACRALGVLYDIFPADKNYEIASRLFDVTPKNADDLFLACAAASQSGWRSRAFEILADLSHEGKMTGSTEQAAVCTWYLSTYGLGVQPLEPGFRSFCVLPEAKLWPWAEGVMPTPRGAVEVSWRKEEKAFAIDLTVPMETAASLVMPPARVTYPRVFCNGALVWEENVFEKGECAGIVDGEENAGIIQFLLQPGRYCFEQAEGEG